MLVIPTALFCIKSHQTIANTYVMAAKEYYLVVLPSISIYLVFLSKRLDFFENLIHELTHMLFSVLTFKRISGLYVSETSGVVYTEGSQKSILIALSPYFFPLFTSLLLALFKIVRVEYSNQIIIVSYTLFMIITLKHLIKDPDEVSSTGVTGWLFLLMVNFWISYFFLSWCISDSLNVKETLITIYDEIRQTISQLKPA